MIRDSQKRMFRNLIKDLSKSKHDKLKERQAIADIIKRADGKPIKMSQYGFCCDTGYFDNHFEEIVVSVMEFVRMQENAAYSSDGNGGIYFV